MERSLCETQPMKYLVPRRIPQIFVVFILQLSDNRITKICQCQHFVLCNCLYCNIAATVSGTSTVFVRDRQSDSGKLCFPHLHLHFGGRNVNISQNNNTSYCYFFCLLSHFFSLCFTRYLQFFFVFLLHTFLLIVFSIFSITLFLFRVSLFPVFLCPGGNVCLFFISGRK